MASSPGLNSNTRFRGAYRRSCPMLEALEPRLLLNGLSQEQAIELFSLSPALFVLNEGQWADPAIRYVHSGSSANVAVTDAGLMFQVFRQAPADPGPADPFGRGLCGTEMVEFSAAFVGAGPVRPVGLDRSETLFNYFVGGQGNWQTDAPAYGKVACEGLYDGIDLVTWGLRTRLKYEFHVAPGSDYSQIAVRYDGIEGLSLGEDGSLTVNLGEGWGVITDDAPYIYQMIDGRPVEVSGQFRLIDRWTYAFEITGWFDPSHELIIDPNVSWSSYLGGSSSEIGYGIAADASGNVLVTGETYSSGWVSGGWDTSYGGGNRDAFVVKLNSAGQHIWSTYLGGSGTDRGYGIAVDSSGNVLVTGETSSSGWVSGGWDTSYGGSGDGFVVKLSPSGGHTWSTYLGGSGPELGWGIAVDTSGNVVVTGETFSAGWVSGGWDTSYGGNGDGFVVKLGPTGGHTWSTYLGGTSYDRGSGIALDSSRNVLVTGGTYSAGWVSGGYRTSSYGDDGFVVKLTSSGGHIWSTYLGGFNFDEGIAVAVDSSGNVLVTGGTHSANWVQGGWDTTQNGSRDAFVVKLSPTGGHIWSTYLGGSYYDAGRGIVVDSSGNVLVTGYSDAGNWVWGGWSTSRIGNTDAFVVKLSPAGRHLWSSFLGGSQYDWGYGIALDPSGNALVAGYTESAGWASGGWDTTYSGGDGFVAKIVIRDRFLPLVDGAAAFIDASGDIVTVTLKGDGTGTLYFPDPGDCDPSLLILEGTTERSSLTITVKGVEGLTRLGGLDVRGGPIARISASSTILRGPLYIGSCPDPRASVAITMAAVHDGCIQSQMPISSLTLSEWLDSDLQGGFIDAPALSRLVVRGDRKRNIRGDFYADVTLRSPGGSTVVASSMSVAGRWYNSDVTVDGVDHRTGLSIKSLTAGLLEYVNVTANGGIGKISTSKWAGGVISAPLVGSVVVKANSRLGTHGDLHADLSVVVLGSVSVAGVWYYSNVTATGYDGASGLSIKSLTAGTATDVSVTALGGIGKISAGGWSSGEISAGWVGSVSTRANRALDTAGDFGADLQLTGAGVPTGKATLGSARIAGDLLAWTRWDIQYGFVGSLAFSGTVLHSIVRSAGNIRSITVGASDGSDFGAGVALGLLETNRHVQVGDVANAPKAAIGTFTVQGLKLPKGTPIPRFFEDSSISAGVGRMNLLNWDGLHGLFAPAGGVGSVRHRDTADGSNSWVWPAPPTQVHSGPGDFVHII